MKAGRSGNLGTNLSHGERRPQLELPETSATVNESNDVFFAGCRGRVGGGISGHDRGPASRRGGDRCPNPSPDRPSSSELPQSICRGDHHRATLGTGGSAKLRSSTAWAASWPPSSMARWRRAPTVSPGRAGSGERRLLLPLRVGQSDDQPEAHPGSLTCRRNGRETRGAARAAPLAWATCEEFCGAGASREGRTMAPR